MAKMPPLMMENGMPTHPREKPLSLTLSRKREKGQT